MIFALLLFLASLDEPPPDPRAQEIVGVLHSTDYPAESIRKREQGTVVVRLTINPEGRVTKCRVAESSGYRRLDAKSCEVILARAHLTPARGDSGKAISDHVVQRITWNLGDPKTSLSDYHRRQTLFIDKDLKISGCKDSLSDSVDPSENYVPNCLSMQSTVDNMVAWAGSYFPDHASVVQIDIYTDFGEQDSAVSEVPNAVLMGEDLARFDVDDTSRRFVECEAVSHQGPLPAVNMCEGGPRVTLPLSSVLDRQAPHSGTVRMRVWLVQNP